MPDLNADSQNSRLKQINSFHKFLKFLHMHTYRYTSYKIGVCTRARLCVLYMVGPICRTILKANSCINLLDYAVDDLCAGNAVSDHLGVYSHVWHGFESKREVGNVKHLPQSIKLLFFYTAKGFPSRSNIHATKTPLFETL